jgi:hypothetical protein
MNNGAVSIIYDGFGNRVAETANGKRGYFTTRYTTYARTDKWIWGLGQTKITFEQHPYDVGAPASHSGPHWHVDWPGAKHKRFSPGDKFPGCS